MELQRCARCKKRPAVVYITRTENQKTISEGLCFPCASELGYAPINDMMKKMGISQEDLDSMSEELDMMMGQGSALPEEIDGGAPAIDFPKLFSNLGMSFGPGPKNAPKGEKAKAPNKNQPERKFLPMYCSNINEKAKSGKIDRIIGRDRELDRVIQILCRRQKNNPCLIGEPGVGKTAIAEALAQRIVDGNVPERLVDSEIWSLDLTALVAGTQFRGQFEQRILGLIKEVKAAGNIILLIDEVHNIVGAGDSEGSMSAANILKPALSRGEIQVIGATTLKEYRKHIEKDTALERRFQPVMVTEPSVDDTVDVIKGIKKYYETFHSVSITDDVARAAVILSERYITDRFLPDKAIDLIDEAASRKALTSEELNEIAKNNKTLASYEKEQNELEALIAKPDGQTEDNYKALADLKVKRLSLETRQNELIEKAKAITLSVNDLAGVIEIWTGIPASDISVGELSDLRTLQDRIKNKIVGQDEAVSAVVRAVKRKRADVSSRRSPVSMIFAGPTGVGKTALVKTLAQELFKQPEALIRLDMSEFMEKHAVSRIIGAPPGYVGYDEAGQLTEKIRRRPYAVILFDEIEKAHPDVLNILLQVLDEGKITDAQGRVVNFENTVIIMTTNAGSEVSSSISGFAANGGSINNDRTQKALTSFLRPEFINRIDEIITFAHLTKEDFVKIADIMLDELKLHLIEKDIAFSYTEEVSQKIANESYSEKFGARNMRRYIERNVEDKIANAIIDISPAKLSGVHLSLKDGEIELSTI